MEALDYCILYKKWSSLSLDNQRGVVKSCAICKILLHRMKSVTESKLLGLQSGFRSGRTTTEQIMTLRFPLDAERTQKRSLTVVYVDYCKAFDSMILVVLMHYGVPHSVVADVKQLYHGSSAAVSTRFVFTETFDTTSGVLQGDTLSPHIFILLVDYIIRQSLVDEDGFTLKPAIGRRYPAVTLTADDVAITRDSASGAEKALIRLQFYSEAVGLKLNAAKTNVLHVGYKCVRQPISTLDGTMINVCDIYDYLGLPTRSSKVVMRRRFTAACHRKNFHSTAQNVFRIGCRSDSSLCTGIHPL